MTSVFVTSHCQTNKYGQHRDILWASSASTTVELKMENVLSEQLLTFACLWHCWSGLYLSVCWRPKQETLLSCHSSLHLPPPMSPDTTPTSPTGRPNQPLALRSPCWKFLTCHTCCPFLDRLQLKAVVNTLGNIQSKYKCSVIRQVCRKKKRAAHWENWYSQSWKVKKRRKKKKNQVWHKINH